GLKAALLRRCAELDLKLLMRDLEPFLYKPADAGHVLLFEEFVKGWQKRSSRFEVEGKDYKGKRKK
ncbi:MAG: hypothetical protein MUO31_13770, partial [Thermodesulfovibrionales bacterium]|nr:hypothetical protein [Thermodesulfovibrionales bacterium]